MALSNAERQQRYIARLKAKGNGAADLSILPDKHRKRIEEAAEYLGLPAAEVLERVLSLGWGPFRLEAQHLPGVSRPRWADWNAWEQRWMGGPASVWLSAHPEVTTDPKKSQRLDTVCRAAVAVGHQMGSNNYFKFLEEALCGPRKAAGDSPHQG